jgi:ABC-2 type transport system permease protein
MNMFRRQFSLELLKLFARKRSYIGFGAFLVAEIFFLLILHIKSVEKMFSKLLEQNGFGFETYYSGLTLAFLIMTNTILILGSLYLALVSGDMIAKEAEEGTLRMVLSRPVSRLRVLSIKYLACIVYTTSLMFFIVLTSLATGIVYRGLGGLFVWAPLEGVFGIYDTGPGLLRFAYAALLLPIVTATITSLGFMFSCFNMKPATATILTLSLFFIDFVLRFIPQFKSIHGYLFTYHMSVWVNVFEFHIPWLKILESMVYLGAFNLTFVTIGALYFNQRDFKS